MFKTENFFVRQWGDDPHPRLRRAYPQGYAGHTVICWPLKKRMRVGARWHGTCTRACACYITVRGGAWRGHTTLNECGMSPVVPRAGVGTITRS